MKIVKLAISALAGCGMLSTAIATNLGYISKEPIYLPDAYLRVLNNNTSFGQEKAYTCPQTSATDKVCTITTRGSGREVGIETRPGFLWEFSTSQRSASDTHKIYIINSGSQNTYIWFHNYDDNRYLYYGSNTDYQLKLRVEANSNIAKNYWRSVAGETCESFDVTDWTIVQIRTPDRGKVTINLEDPGGCTEDDQA